MGNNVLGRCMAMYKACPPFNGEKPESVLLGRPDLMRNRCRAWDKTQ